MDSVPPLISVRVFYTDQQTMDFMLCLIDAFVRCILIVGEWHSNSLFLVVVYDAPTVPLLAVFYYE